MARHKHYHRVIAFAHNGAAINRIEQTLYLRPGKVFGISPGMKPAGRLDVVGPVAVQYAGYEQIVCERAQSTNCVHLGVVTFRALDTKGLQILQC